MTTDELLKFLEENDIAYERFDHPPVYTCAEANSLVPDLPGARTKNLFLRDRKGKRHFLVVMSDEREVDLKALSHSLDADKLSFGSPERMKKHLAIEPGAVSLLAITNDNASAVELVIEESLWQSDFLQCHPLVNTSTLVLSKKDLERLVHMTGHVPRIIEGTSPSSN